MDLELAKNMPEMIMNMEPEQCKAIFSEIVQVCLWGNATDLEPFNKYDGGRHKRPQAVGSDYLEGKKVHLVDDTDRLWEEVELLQSGRVDFVLDNSGTGFAQEDMFNEISWIIGFEVFVDLILTDLALAKEKGLQSRLSLQDDSLVCFGCDAQDIDIILESCLNRKFFSIRRQSTFGRIRRFWK